MELIDRDAFMKDLAERTEANKYLFNDDAQYMNAVMVMNGFFRDLKEFPTVEVESRPTGEWIDYSEDGYVECPFCHEATNCEDNIGELHYCWNGGAEMGGKE